MTAKIVQLDPREVRLKRRIRQRLKAMGFLRDESGKLIPPSLDKDAYRKIHEDQRLAKLKKSAAWIDRKSPKLARFFASGSDIDPCKIAPELRLVRSGTTNSDLFRLGALNWRIPVSEGYGRRMRFLVWDKGHDRLLGLIALGDAVFNQAARDQFVGWDHNRRSQALVNMMDAYVLGALPPYSSLLGGKLVASLIRTREVVEAFEQKYKDSVGLISGERKSARLAAITTSSALGRSSIYNRLALDGRKILSPIGFTSGWGHFHFSAELFDELREYLGRLEDPYAQGFNFGSGPNWKIRVIRKALERLGLNTALTQHGFQREVFFCSVAANATAFLRGDDASVRYEDLPSVAEAAEKALARWVLPRASRDDSYKAVLGSCFLNDFGELSSSDRRERVLRP